MKKNFNCSRKVTCESLRVANGKFETLQDGKTSIFSASPRLFDFLDCKIETQRWLHEKIETARPAELPKKRDCETCEIQLNLNCKTRIF